MNSEHRATVGADVGDVSLTDTGEGHSDSGIFGSFRDESFWEIDRSLPAWARRSNPIVRRHLGGFLSAPIPQRDLLVRIIAPQIAVVMVSILFPIVLEIVALIGLVSLIVIPICLSAYAGALFVIGRLTAESVLVERENRALETLRTTPLTLHSILLSKIAAGLWQQAVNLDTIILAVALVSLPVITIQQATLYEPTKYPGVAQGLIIAGVLVSVIRLIIEPFMIGAIGVLVGTIARMRFAATIWTGLISASYFTLINLPRLGALTWQARLVVETILPLILPIPIALLALLLASRTLRRE